MDEDTIPLEAGLESRAISLTKGCYVGQEVIVRVLHRGHGRVARRLVGLTLDGEAVPAAGTPVQADGRDVGRVTSAVASVALNTPIALAYVHRDFTEAGTRVTVDGAEGVVTACRSLRREPNAKLLCVLCVLGGKPFLATCSDTTPDKIRINSVSAGGNSSVRELFSRHPSHLLPLLRRRLSCRARSGENAARRERSG